LDSEKRQKGSETSEADVEEELDEALDLVERSSEKSPEALEEE
jgi:hypothetical protein